MKTITLTLKNAEGLHLRPAQQLCNTANEFQAEINLQNGDQVANVKSVLGIISLGLEKGSEFTLSADGPDEDEALKALVDLVEKGFGE